MHPYAQPGFHSAQKKRKTFAPSEEQINTAMRRIKCAIERCGGTLWALNQKEAISFLEKHVNNRGDELGSRRKGHFRKVLVAAWKKLQQLREVVFDADRYEFTLNYRFEKRGRSHRQKYPAGRLAMHTL